MKELCSIEEVLVSWKKCINEGLSGNISYPVINYTGEELKSRQAKSSEIVDVFKSFAEDITHLNIDECMLFFTDPEGVLVEKCGKTLKNKKHDHMIGMSFAENSIGTNAIALSIQLDKPIYTLPQHHYCDFLKTWYIYAMPIKSENEVRGCLAVAAVGQPLKMELIAITRLLHYQIVSEYKKVLRQRQIGVESKIEFNDKQMAILKSFARGLTDNAIALNMGLSMSTIKYHKQNIFKVLNASCSVEAVIKALKLNIISIEQIEV